MLFRSRLGFSGTPSDLLPAELGRCGFEVGSDGKMFAVLTDPNVVTVTAAPTDWGVDSLLTKVASDESHFSALIDSGALITGLSNLRVAEVLLERGLRWCEGVVFLAENDVISILVRATGRVVSLSQCGIAVEKRFVFYDQIHTTGIDIKYRESNSRPSKILHRMTNFSSEIWSKVEFDDRRSALTARAAVTLGKDMTFRDLAQGAFRMRGIAEGQTITIIMIPEVEQVLSTHPLLPRALLSLTQPTHSL